MNQQPGRGGSFARAARARVSFSELALALAAEFGAVDGAGAVAALDELAGRLCHTRDLPPEAQLEAVAEVLAGHRTVHDPVRVRPLMLDAVLGDRAGDPLTLAVLAADVARRAGLEIGIVGTRRRLLVAHRQAWRAGVLDFAGSKRSPREIPERGVGWRCAHQVSFALLDELTSRARRSGDVGVALHAARLRLELPLDARTRSSLTADVAYLRSMLN